MRGRAYLIFLFLFLAIVVLLNLPLPVSMRLKSGTRDNLAPFQTVVSILVGKVGAVASTMAQMIKSADADRALTEKVAALSLKVAELESIERDYEKLRKHVEFSKLQKHELLLCEIVSRGDASGWWQIIRVNRGSDHGVGRNMAVVSVEGLIGKTVEVSHDTCDVLLITDPNSKVAGRLAEAGATGIVVGKGVAIHGEGKAELLCSLRPCLMNYVSTDVKIASGAAVVTSGLGGVYPEGLLLGHVKEVQMDKSKLFQRAEVAPAADMGSLKYVFVVLK